MKIEEVAELAAAHLDRLRHDISLCRTRDEHIRVTARANEAAELFRLLQDG